MDRLTSRLTCVFGACIMMLAFTVSSAAAQRAGFNYDEARVPQYTLPDPLVMLDGTRVTEANQWPARRAEILTLFETHVYGRTPDQALADLRFEIVESGPALDGQAVRKQVKATFSDDPQAPTMEILIYLPAEADGPVPIFLGLNFFGNQTIHRDPAIRISRKWMRPNADLGIVANRATEASRGVRADRWPVEMVLQRGYGLATIYCGDLDLDINDNFAHAVQRLFYRPGQTQPAADEWGTLGAWAWGLSRAMDYFEQDEAIDHQRVAIMGHSRLGKTSLWAGAQDERFAIVISNNSGCGGAALSRRRFGETVARINTNFPHWFCDNFNHYSNNEDELPVDQHMLITLMAPRPVYIASASDDGWADPRGEFLAGYHANPVYAMFGLTGTGADDIPPVQQPIGDHIGYHLRQGRHNVTAYDWEQWLNFADRHFGLGTGQPQP